MQDDDRRARYSDNPSFGRQGFDDDRAFDDDRIVDDSGGGDTDERGLLSLPPEIVSVVIQLVARGDVRSLAQLCASSRTLKGFCATPLIQRDAIDPTVASLIPAPALGGGALVSPADVVVAYRRALVLVPAVTRHALFATATGGEGSGFTLPMPGGPPPRPRAVRPPLSAFMDPVESAHHFATLLTSNDVFNIEVRDNATRPFRTTTVRGSPIVPDARQRETINGALTQYAADLGIVYPVSPDLFGVFPLAARHVRQIPVRGMTSTVLALGVPTLIRDIVDDTLGPDALSPLP
ncbi:hypothetical protein pdul_cds_183 [Pandoravirus dulcis]|uniref:DUF5902 domain-containing protein n=1 Tax=Pandoravirus dulcis TaxID=1349409 RepID=S4VVI9_9VIRU|nr:hypothetical protein pdul_cds_183 [Pandoravirus dulcis]AGO82111.1 hypothetical protein pdul_cds_183 [Pandoravirus dulcis]